MTDAVLLDVGGVLLLPDPHTVRRALPAGVEPTTDRMDRAHYHAVAANDAVGAFDRRRYLTDYVQCLGVSPDEADAVADRFDPIFTGHGWSRVARGAASGLRRLVGTGTPVGIVSNADGTVAEMLGRAGLCQVGPGPHVEVRVVVDSTVVGVAKPDPAIFRFALAELPGAKKVMYVGDTGCLDVVSARLAGLRPVHMDPYGFCPRPDDHEHVADLAELLPLISENQSVCR
jgi:putative hydrolase of the HAD superfamily